MKYLVRLTYLALVLALILNFRWVHAASVTLLAEPCEPLLRSQAHARVAELFGDTQSRPLIHCLSEPALGLDVSHGRTNFAPLLPAVVLIGPQGANVDVLAHEWAHAEISHRLGFLQRTFGFPVWVDEGLAMQVDYRPEYNLKALRQYQSQPDLIVPTAAAISSSKFFVASTQGKLHYTVSRCAVAAWLSQRPNWLDMLTTDRPTAIDELTQTFNQCT